MKNVSDFSDYIKYLDSVFPTTGSQRGIRTKLAEAIGCRLSFVSQVLTGRADFSLEQGIAVCQFLELDALDAEYFMLLLSKAKAGTPTLREFYQGQIKSKAAEINLIKHRIKHKAAIPEEAAKIYYSNWLYSAIHIRSALPGKNSRETMATFFNIPKSAANEIIDFLVQHQFLQEDKEGQLKIGLARVHLPNDSAIVWQHHTNYRLYAISKFLEGKSGGLHYSASYTMGRVDFENLKKMYLDTLARSEKILKESPDEAFVNVCFDLFEVSSKK